MEEGGAGCGARDEEEAGVAFGCVTALGFRQRVKANGLARPLVRACDAERDCVPSASVAVSATCKVTSSFHASSECLEARGFATPLPLSRSPEMTKGASPQTALVLVQNGNLRLSDNRTLAAAANAGQTALAFAYILDASTFGDKAPFMSISKAAFLVSAIEAFREHLAHTYGASLILRVAGTHSDAATSVAQLCTELGTQTVYAQAQEQGGSDALSIVLGEHGIVLHTVQDDALCELSVPSEQLPSSFFQFRESPERFAKFLHPRARLRALNLLDVGAIDSLKTVPSLFELGYSNAAHRLAPFRSESLTGGELAAERELRRLEQRSIAESRTFCACELSLWLECGCISARQLFARARASHRKLRHELLWNEFWRLRDQVPRLQPTRAVALARSC